MSTPATSTTRWPCSAPTSSSSASTATKVADSRALRGRDLRPRPDGRRHRHRPDDDDGPALPIYDASLTLHNSNTAGAGGMLTFLAVRVRAQPPTRRVR